MSIKGTILVVEDTHANKIMLTGLLKAEGYEVRSVNSGDLALASVAVNPADLILLDIHLPGMDGLEVLRRLKTQPESQNIPVIILSAITDEEERVEGLKLGAVDFISKPFQLEELLAHVQTHIKLSKMGSILGETEIHPEEERVLLRKLIDNLPDVIYVKDTKGRRILLNIAGWQANGGKSMEDVIGKTDFDTYPRELAETFWAIDKEVMVSGIPILNHEEPGIDSDGNPTWVLTTKMPLRDNQGKIVGLMGIGHNITRRKQMEEALHENEAKMRAISDSAHDGILMMDPKGRIIYWNPAAESLLGYSNTEAMGLILHDLIAPKRYHKAHHAAFPAFVDTGQGSELGKTHEVGALKKDGSEIPIQLSLSSFQMNGEWYAVGIISDISERKKNELLQNVIYRISQATMTSGGIDDLYQSIHSILGEYIPAKNFFIALYDPAEELISFPYYIDQFDDKPSAPIKNQGLTGYVINTRKSLLATREIYNQLVQKGELDVVGTPGEDWLGVPLKTDGRVIGVMAVQSYDKEIHFQKKDVDLLEFVSTQVSQAIERKRLEDEILSLSLTDELTGLYNRRGFMVLAEQEVKLAHRKKRNMLLFFGDVDKLKTINDTQGHAQGDLALKEVSIILKKIFREADIIARIGGDEFVALALDASHEGEKILKDRIQSAFEIRNQQGDMAFNLSLSLGIVCYDPEAPITVSKLIARADELMYQQKQAKN